MTYFPNFKRNAEKEIYAIDPTAQCKVFTWESTLVDTQLENEKFVSMMKKSQPVFIRHMMPVQAEFLLIEHKSEDLHTILEKVKPICPLRARDYFAVQARVVDGKGDYNSKDIEIYLGEYYESRGSIPVFSDDQIMNVNLYVLSVFVKDQHGYIGYSNAADNLNFHSNEYRVLGKQPPEISRAENKLKEAINQFHVHLGGKGYALDIGAAPGGWTKVLADYGYQVDAVDPGELDERLKAYQNIKHYKSRIEDTHFNHPFNLVTCDMNVDAIIASKLICQLHQQIETNGYCIITLKLPFKDEEIRIQKCVALLEKYFQIITIRNLTHNRREVTVYMKHKAAAVS